MTTNPIIGTAEDFTIEVLSEIGGRVKNSALEAVAIDDRKLAQEAMELPQLLFYYQAAYCRLSIRAAQAKIKLKEIEANAYLNCKAASAKTGTKMTQDEINACVTIDQTVQSQAREHAELEAKCDAVKGILEALRSKGYSLQLVASIRGKEEEWLRSNFVEKLENHPHHNELLDLLKKLT